VDTPDVAVCVIGQYSDRWYSVEVEIVLSQVVYHLPVLFRESSLYFTLREKLSDIFGPQFWLH